MKTQKPDYQTIVEDWKESPNTGIPDTIKAINELLKPHKIKIYCQRLPSTEDSDSPGFMLSTVPLSRNVVTILDAEDIGLYSKRVIAKMKKEAGVKW